MDDTIKHVFVGSLKAIKNYLENNSYDDVHPFTSSMVNISILSSSKLGVFVGEVVDSIMMNLSMSIDDYSLDDDKLSEELSGLLPLLDNLIGSIESNDESKIYSSLVEFRFYVTEMQQRFPKLYRKSIKNLRGRYRG